MSSRKATIPAATRTELAAALLSCRSALFGIGVFSFISSVLMLTGSLFMLEVYDRVLPSRSVPTLIGLAVIALILFVFQGAIDLVRSRMLARVGRAQEEALGRRVFEAVMRLPLKMQGGGQGLQPLRDLDQLRAFLSSGGPVALFDLPWMPLYLGVCFLFHFWIGMAALAGALVLVGVTLATELLMREPAKAVAAHATMRSTLAAAGRRNTEVLQAMGMAGRMAALWGAANKDYLAAHERASDVAGGLGTISRV